MKHQHYEAGTRKKRPASRVFFFLPAFGRCRPSVSAHPAHRIHCSSNIAIADHFPSKTFSFKHHLTGEAWPAWPASRVFFFLPAFGRCRPSVSAHPANRIRCSSNIAIADHFPSKTFSFKHHFQDRRGQLAEQFYLFIQTPLAIADHFPSKTFSFKHHLTGEAWPACRANLPFHSNTT